MSRCVHIGSSSEENDDVRCNSKLPPRLLGASADALADGTLVDNSCDSRYIEQNKRARKPRASNGSMSRAR